MKYISTRDSGMSVSSAQAIARGISRESGLFVPEKLPMLTKERLNTLIGMSYSERAADILGSFLTDFTPEELKNATRAAYSTERFPKGVTPIKHLSDGVYMMELWHGPTCAFKDVALQLLPHLLTLSVKKTANGKKVCILAATSGDTGKAALEGFKDVDGTQILVFYPDGGVSKVQYLQMAAQDGSNIGVCGVCGNFDDTQTGVKRIFTDPAILKKLDDKGIMFSSANSINWGRLAPQIVYYISAYCDMISNGDIKDGEKINICVPTGNFGNILAAYYAWEMGLPVNKLICASNMNNVLTDFINTGTYDKRREFHLTVSPSMDILISSNLERLIFALYRGDSTAVSGLMNELANNGIYSISDDARSELKKRFYGGFCTEENTLKTIKDTFNKYSYLCDTHTAVAVDVYNEYREKTGDNTKTLIASTANPHKFAPAILEALTGEKSALEELEQLAELERVSGLEIPPQIRELSSKTVRFKDVCGIDEMSGVVENMLGIIG